MSDIKNNFSWVKTHKELVQYLIGKESEQKELIELLKDSGATMFNDRDESGNIIELEEIDPFTFFCYFHKYGDEKRLKIFQNISKQLGLPAPSDFSGIPSANALKVWLFPYKKFRKNNEVQRLWSFFYNAVNNTVTEELFQNITDIHNVGRTKITEGLFYIQPENYFPINSPAKSYLKEVLRIDPKFKTWTEYLKILDQIREKTDKPFYEISHEAWLWNDERKSEESELSDWLDLVVQYKAHLRENSHLEEIYKWEATKHFQETLDLNAEDFTANFKQALSKSSNLLYQNSKAFITKAAEYYPDQIREMFTDLYDENEPLQKRVQQFVNRAKELEPKVSEKHGKQLNHQQDERTLSFYLTMKYPDRYPLYKDEIYQFLVSHFPAEKPKPAGDKFFHYLEIGEKLIPTIEGDDELFELATQNLNENCYIEEQKWLVFQDILWVNKRQIESDSDVNYWLFQGNHFLFNVEQALKDEMLTSWRVNAQKEKIKPGDKVIIWVTGEHGGCYALAEVISEVYKDSSKEDEIRYYKDDVPEESHDQVQLQITHNLAHNPVTVERVKADPRFGDLNVGKQGTNFSATQEEYEAFLDIIDATSGDPKWDELVRVVQKIDDEEAVRKFFNTVGRVMHHFHLSPDDKITYASSINKYLQFTIGSRYVTHLERKKRQTIQGFYVDNLHLDQLKADVPDLNVSDKSLPPEEGEMTWVYLKSEDVLVENFLGGITALAGRGVEGQEKSQFRFRYPGIHNPWIAKVALDDSLLETLLRGEKMVAHKEIVEVNYPLNTIFYGPPGTGKTYNTIHRAAEIVEGRKIEAYKEAKEIFSRCLGNTIEFITFHQNYSYEDFIQGLRPDIENSQQLTFERTDGVFKKLADKALKNWKASEKPQAKKQSFEEVFNDFIHPLVMGEVEEIEVEMKRVSYFITAVTDKSIEFRKSSGDSVHTLSINTLRKMYDAEDVMKVQGLSSYYSPLLGELLDKGMSPGETEITKREYYVMIIDEINRANISRVFGELITLIEPDKRYGREHHIPAKLPSGEEFSVPENLYIIGTMNTADKSIALLDIALRRRFEFEAMYPKYEINGAKVYDADVLEKINERIVKLKGHDFQIGHSYFMKNHMTLKQRMNRKVIPLLLEYFMNDEKEVRGILDHAGLDIEEKTWPLLINGKK